MHVDLTNCDREPIHQLGAIQPVGFLIAVAPDWLIQRASVNVELYLGQSAEDLIGQPLDRIFSRTAVHSLRNRLAMLRGADAVERIFNIQLTSGPECYDVALHLSGGRIIIEAEVASDEHGDATGVVRSMIARLDQAQTMAAFFNEGARQVKALTGYDRVMVYRFAPDESGEVVAEAAKPGIGNFLGLHYPASDIPRQARQLYARSLLRVISDVDAAPVPIHPQLDEEGKPLDLSLSILRSVSPIHLEYLRNMGVGASMSISIIVDGKLWGLFACHHYSPRRVSFERRSVCELFAQMFSMRLESRERQQTVEFERRARDIADQLLGAVASDDTLLNNPDWLSDILTGAIAADGVGVWIGGHYAFTGQTPTTDEFARIIKALNGTAGGKVLATDHIASIVPGAERFASAAAGMLAIPISRTPRDYVVLFRQEIVRSVRWAGDPHKPAEFGPNGPRLTPRKSFEEWKELVEGRSLPFTASEVRVAETLRATLIEVVLRLADDASAERTAASARQELLIAELNHRVRNILGVIRGLIRQSKPSSGSIEDFVKLVDGRVHALARAHNQITEDHWGPAPFRALIDAEAAAFADSSDRVTVDGPAVLLNPQAYSTMALVVHELVTNSAKYGSLSNDGKVEVRWHVENDGDLVVDWKEIGGPPVKPPTRKGFGSTIIDRSVPYDLGGKAMIDYPESGVEARFRIPARHVSHGQQAIDRLPTPRKAADRSGGHVKAEAPSSLLKGCNVLLVEDSLIIALDVEDILQRLGAASVITAATVEDALLTLGDTHISVAMLDINLGDQNSFPVADRLRELGVPFMFATGYGEQAQLPPAHKARIVLQKPYTLANVVRALPHLLAESVVAAK